jgi:hypothetical protein
MPEAEVAAIVGTIHTAFIAQTFPERHAPKDHSGVLGALSTLPTTTGTDAPTSLLVSVRRMISSGLAVSVAD